MNKIEINNLKMGYVLLGEGPLVVLLHGYGGNHLDWMEVVEELSEGYTYLIVNYKNFFLQKESISFSGQQVHMLQFIRAVMEKHELGSEFHLVTTSYGSALGLGLQTQLHKGVASHLMVNPMPYNPLKKLRSFPIKVLMRISRHHYLFKYFIRTSIGKNYLSVVCNIFGLGSLNRLLNKRNDLRKVVYIRRAIENFYNTVKGEEWKVYYDQLESLSKARMLAYISVSDELFSRASYSKILKKLDNIRVCYLSGAGHLVIKNDPKLIAHYVNEHLKSFGTNSELVS